MHSLEANLTLPHPVEPALLLRLSASRALPSPTLALVESLAEALGTEGLSRLRAKGALSEQRSRGAEERGCRGHPGEVF